MGQSARRRAVGNIQGGYPLIVGITGTWVAFPRLVRALADYAGNHPSEEVWVQHGAADLPRGLVGIALTPRDELLARIRAARAVICHGGSGTVFDVLALGHVPVVMPRRAHLREHVNDHQLELAERLRQQGRAIVITDSSQLEEAIALASASSTVPAPVGSAPPLAKALGDDCVSLLSGATNPWLRWRIMRVLTTWVPRHEVQGLRGATAASEKC